MAFFLETLLGGLMAGMLYSLVALGFVLIFKASGVFNFAKGAMVLFGALAMARFSEWIPQWTGIHNLVFANAVAFVVAGVTTRVRAMGLWGRVRVLGGWAMSRSRPPCGRRVPARARHLVYFACTRGNRAAHVSCGRPEAAPGGKQ